MSRLLAIALLSLPGCLDAFAPDVGPLHAMPAPNDAMPADDSMAAGCDRDSDAARDVSFATDVSPIIRRDCDRCHRPGREGEQMSGLDLSTYDSLRAGGTRSVGTIVIDRMPCASVLWQKTGSAPPFGARMPRQAGPLSDADRLLIHDWIAEGAQND